MTLKVAAPAAGGAVTVSQLVPSVPPQFTEALANVGAWKALAAQAAQLPVEMQALGAGGGVTLAILAVGKMILKV